MIGFDTSTALVTAKSLAARCDSIVRQYFPHRTNCIALKALAITKAKRKVLSVVAADICKNIFEDRNMVEVQECFHWASGMQDFIKDNPDIKVYCINLAILKRLDNFNSTYGPVQTTLKELNAQNTAAELDVARPVCDQAYADWRKKITGS